jgi:antitoxin component YwqK of YwqJK toxin-antitoxin module
MPQIAESVKSGIFLLFMLIGSISLSQNDCIRDTSYHSNGAINTIFGYDETTHEYCGLYTFFDSLGVKLSEGEYRKVDSVECIGCYREDYRNKDEKWSQYFVSRADRILVGEWKYYHENGQLKEIGRYCDAVHEYTGSAYPLDWEGKSWPEPVNGYLTYEYLKDGIWECYDVDGNHIKTEEYVCGQLVNLTERY